MFDRLNFMIGESVQGLRRNGLLTFAAITTLAVALFLIGGFGYLYFRAYGYVQNLPKQLEVRVYMKDDLAPQDVAGLGETISRLHGVATTKFISKDDAWATMRAQHPEIPADLANPLPDAYAVTFATVRDADDGAAALEGEPSVDKVLYEKELIRVLRQAIGVLRYAGYFGLLLLLIGGIISYNAIQLTISARTREIRIMHLVGASRATVRVPFMLEGLFHGVVGGVLAGIFLAAADRAARHYVAGLGLALPPFPQFQLGGLVAACGAAMGLVCSSVAVRLLVKN